MKNKLLMILTTIIIIVLTAMLGINLKMYIDNREKSSIRPIIESQQNLDEDVKKAINLLYKITDDNRDRIVYQYVPDENYVMEPAIKKNYYIFNVIEADEDGQITNIRKCNYLVNKNTNATNVYFAVGQMSALSDANSWKVESKYQNSFYKLTPELKKAYERIKNITGEINYKYEYAPDLEEAGNKECGLNGEYYIFRNYDLDENAYFGDESDINLAVKKDNMKVYQFSFGAYPNNYLLPYGDENIGLEKWQVECKEEHVVYGYEMCPDEESHRIQSRDLRSTSTSGDPGNKIDIDAGIDWYKNECISMHDGECKNIGEHQAKVIMSNNDKYSGIDIAFQEKLAKGCSEGYQYSRFFQNQWLEGYIAQNKPSDEDDIWEVGFRETFAKYRSYYN